MFLSRLRKKTQIRRRKGGRETLAEDAVRFQDVVVSKTQERGVPVPAKLMRELQRGSEQRDGGKRLYKLDIRRAHLADAHVEALTEALQELPVVRKLDLRGNDALTVQGLNALNVLLKGQVELFRLVQADPSLADSSLSFLYSVKLDASVLSLDRTATEELEARTAALEVADSVLDVRHAFFEADVRESGTLTEHELSDAMRTVMGATPKAAETSRVLRFFGEPAAEGRNPTMINLGGFEAAMAGRLRESHTLPVLPQRRDDLLFGSAENTGDQADSDCFSPWSTRSFGATTGGFHGNTGGGGRGGGNKRSPLSASQDLHSAAGMRTHLLPLPPWRGGEGGSELDGTFKGDEQGRNPMEGIDLENIFDDHNNNDLGEGNGNGEHATTPRRGSETGQPVVGDSTENDSSGCKSRRSRSSSENKGVDGDRDGQAAQDNGLRKSDTPAQQVGMNSAVHLQRNSTSRVSLKDGGREDFVLTDGSSDDELSCSSPAQSKGGGLITRKGSRLRNENPTLSSEPTGDTSSPTPTDAGVPDRRRHSSGPSPAVRSAEENDEITESIRSAKRVAFSEGPASGDKRVSSTPQYSLSDNQSAEGEEGSDVSTCQRYSSREGRQNDDDATGRSSEGQVVIRGQEGLSTDIEPSPLRRPSILAAHQTTATRTCFQQGDQEDTLLAPPNKVDEAGALTGAHGGLDICLRGVTTKETETHSDAREEEYTCVAPPEIEVGGTPTINVSESAATTASSRGVVTQLESGVAVKERELGNEDSTSSAGEYRQSEGDGGKLRFASTPSSLDQDGHRPSTLTMTSIDTAKRYGEETKMSNTAAPAGAATTTDTGPPSAVGVGSNVGGSLKARGSAQDLSISNNICASPQSGATATLVQAVPTGTTQDSASSGEDIPMEDNPQSLVDKSGVTIRSPLEAITEVQSGESIGDSSNDDARGSLSPTAPSAAVVSTLDSEHCGGGIRKPYCLSPTNVMRQARGSGATAMVGSSCRERERLAARIQLSAVVNAAGTAAAVTGFNIEPHGIAPGPLPLDSSISGSCFDGGFTPDRGGREEGGWTSGDGSPVGYNADKKCSRSAGKTPSSPERKERGSGRLDGGGASIENDHCSSSSPSSRFYLPSSETKTAPLHGAGGSTSLYEGSALAANKSIPSGRRGEGAWCFSRVGPEAAIQGGGRGHAETTDIIAGEEAKNGCDLLRLDEEQLVLRLNEGALVISRSGLAKMGAVLEMEAVSGCGQDTIIGLHTLILSYNQLQVLDMSVLTTMPALRHLDISHNLLCRMEPMDGRDLPPRLETLNMSHNRISRIGGIGQCFLLRVVDLRHNRIKRVQGLEHLSLLEQLDLGHNLISKTASARALSFNRSLKLLRLEGNPLARHPRYRPTLTCLLPHVRVIDSRGMPPSSDAEQRRWVGGGGSMGEDDESERLKGTTAAGVTMRGGHARGGGNVSISREWQSGQDERRSKEWRQVMEWRKDQARREEEAKGLMSGARHGSRQVVNAAQQKRLAGELARPRPRTCPSEEAITKAKALACHRPAVVFGVSYRGNTGRDTSSSDAGYMSSAGMTAKANEPPPPPSPGKHYHHDLQQQQQHQHQRQEHLFGTSADGYKFHRELAGGGGGRESNDTVLFGDTLGCGEMMPQNRPEDSESLQPAQKGNGDASASRIPSFRWSTVNGVHCCDDRSLSVPTFVPDDAGEATARRAKENEGLQASNDDHSVVQGHATKALEGREGASAGSSDTGLQRNEVVESWLLDVRLETETAGTALRVLLRMCKERGRHDDEKIRLSSFRTALEGMGLFSPQHGPMPTSFDGDDGGALALKVKAAARRVAMTKAAVKNMLRLLESAEPGEVGIAEINQYADFIQQQGEIMTGGGDHQNEDKSCTTAKREEVTSTAGGAERNGDNAKPSLLSVETVTSNNDAVAVGSLASISTIATAETPAGVNGAQMAHRTSIVPLEVNGGLDNGVAGAYEASRDQQHVNMHSSRGKSELLLNTAASARQMTAVDDAEPSSAISCSNAFVAAIDPVLAPTEGAKVALAAGNNTMSTRVKDVEGETADKDSVDFCSKLAASPSADAQCLSSARKLVDSEGTISKGKEGERRRHSLDQGEERAAEAMVPASPSSVSRPNATATATATAAATATAPSSGKPYSSSLQVKGDAVVTDVDGSGENVGVTAFALAADVSPATGIAPATDVPAGQEVGTEITTPVLTASPTVGDTSAALSARERLLRYVRAATSPRSDASSCSSGSDEDEGDVREAATEAVQLQQDTNPAQEEASGEECTGEGATGVGGDPDPASVVATQTRSGTAGIRADGRSLTTRPAKRPQAAYSGDEGGGGRGGGEKKIAADDTCGECGVPSAITQCPSSAAPAEARDRTAVLLDEDASSVALTTPDISQDDERNAGVSLILETVDTAAACLSDGKENSGIGPAHSGDTLAQDKDGRIPSDTTKRAVFNGGIANDADTNGIGYSLEASTLDATEEAEQKDSEGTHDIAASASTISARSGTIECGNGDEGKALQVAKVGVAAESGSTKAASESDQRSAGSRDGDSIAIPGKTAQAAEDTEEQANTRPKPSSEACGNTPAIGGENDIAGAADAATEPDWIEGYDPGHDCYYYHHVPTGESRWYKPDEPYEPYVHSDEDQDGEDVPPSSADGNFQTAKAGPEDEKNHQRLERRVQRENDRQIDSTNHRRERTGSGEGEIGVRSTRSSSVHKSKKSSSRRRTSKSSRATATELHRRSRYDNGDDERYASRSPSRDDWRGDGRRRSKESSSRQRGKTALERLNDLTDENSGASGDLQSDDSDGGRSLRRGGSSRQDNRGSRRNSNEHQHGSSRKRSSGVRSKTRQGSATREKGYDEDDGTQSRSTKSSRSIMSSDGSRSGNNDDHRRGTSHTKRSGSSRRGSESRRKSR